MNNNIIKLSITDRTGSGYNHVTLYTGTDQTPPKDCGMLYLSDDELEHLTSVIQNGVAELNLSNESNHTLEVDNQILATDY